MVKRITFKERERIEKLLNKNKNIAQIALRLERPRTTLAYEIKKGSKNGIYQAEYAQEKTNILKTKKVTTKSMCLEKPQSKKKCNSFEGKTRFSITVPTNLIAKIDLERKKRAGNVCRNQWIVEKLNDALIKSSVDKSFAKAK